MQDISWLAEQLLAFQGGLFPMELVSYFVCLFVGGENLDFYDFYPLHQIFCVCNTHEGEGTNLYTISFGECRGKRAFSR
jgi:hypothetical protein